LVKGQHRSGSRRWQAIDGFRNEQWSCPRQPRSKPRRCRPPSQEDRFAGGQVPCGAQLVDPGDRRPGAEKEILGVSYPASAYRDHDRQRVKFALWEPEGKIVPGQPFGERPLEGRGTPRAGVTFGCGRQRSVQLTPSHLKGTRRDLLAGYERFSESATERRAADLSVTATFTTGLSRHNVSINHNATTGRSTRKRSPADGREPSRPVSLGVRGHASTSCIKGVMLLAFSAQGLWLSQNAAQTEKCGECLCKSGARQTRSCILI
jgi:hypothetical protein